MLELSDCTFHGHALPEPFVKFELEGRLTKAGLLAKTSGPEGKELQEEWETYRRVLRSLGATGGPIHVVKHVVAPLGGTLGYGTLNCQETVETREGEEDGGWVFSETTGGVSLRAFASDVGADLDAPGRRGRAYRFSPERVAQRVLLARGERAALLTNGLQLRLLLCDPARPESHVGLRLDRGSGGWAGRPRVPDSFRLLVALASPRGLALLPELVEAARLNQTTVTKNLRKQARAAVEGFIQEVLDRPENARRVAGQNDHAFARELWREGLILVYRILFTLKLEASADPARAFSFASTTLWRNTFSPNAALGPVARAVLKEHAETGRLLEDGLRTMFRLFSSGISASELKISALGGALFGESTTPLLDSLHWGERAVAKLLVNLLWTEGKEGEQRVHYGTLDVEDLGRVYESLLELEPGISGETMCRLRRQKLEVVVPLAQGEAYREKAKPSLREAHEEADGEDEVEENGGADADEAPRGKKTKVLWIEEIPPGRFFLRVGLGRKSTGAYYTPHPFVRFLVQETLGPQAAERSPAFDPNPVALLKLKVLDPAMGSGHFLVEACRFLGEKLYEACRLCDELAVEAEDAAHNASAESGREAHRRRASDLRGRVEALPDPDDQMLAYLPSRVPEGESAGLSQSKALALARRLVAVHCLYGVDKNPLAVELAKLALWLESYAEGLPLTFLDHRLKCGDSLTGPLFENLLTFPGSGKKVEGLFANGLKESLTATLNDALSHVRDLEGSVGKDVADLEAKRGAKKRLDAALAPFRLLAAAWSGGVMLGLPACDDVAYLELLKAVAEKTDPRDVLAASNELARMADIGCDGVPYDLTFPEVFFPGVTGTSCGFDAVVGNPPWDKIMPAAKEFFAAFDLGVVDAGSSTERERIEERLREDPSIEGQFRDYWQSFDTLKALLERLYRWQDIDVAGERSGAQPDAYRYFVERVAHLTSFSGRVGVVVPSAFHANEGATGVRKLYLEKMALQCCYSFENRKRLFEIHASFKFALVVASKNGPTVDFSCAFYLHEMAWLFGDRGTRELRFSLAFVQRTGGRYLSLLELHSRTDVIGVQTCFDGAKSSLEDFLASIHLSCGEELNRTRQAGRLRRMSDPVRGLGGDLRVLEGKNIWQFDDCYAVSGMFVPLGEMLDRRDVLALTVFYRFGYRLIASSTNERTLIAAVLPPGVVCTNSVSVERSGPSPRSAVLGLAALWNAYVMDWLARQRVGATVNKFLLETIPVPSHGAAAQGLLSHSALRLICNHAGYSALWREQVGEAWREPKPAFTWPVLEEDDARWAVRAGIDAAVADAYGLNREQYAHVLSTFSHKSYAKAPELCLAAFDELKEIGLDAFAKKHDPYWNIPLNESLPKPVIDIPMPTGPEGQLDLALENAARATSPGTKRPRRPGGRRRA